MPVMDSEFLMNALAKEIQHKEGVEKHTCY